MSCFAQQIVQNLKILNLQKQKVTHTGEVGMFVTVA